MLITAAEAAEILGMQLQSIYDAASRGRITRHAPSHVRRAYDRKEIEALSLKRLPHRSHPPHPYWATVEEAAAVLGMSRSNVQLMMIADRLPHEIAANRRHYPPAPARGHRQRPRDSANRGSPPLGVTRARICDPVHRP